MEQEWEVINLLRHIRITIDSLNQLYDFGGGCLVENTHDAVGVHVGEGAFE